MKSAQSNVLALLLLAVEAASGSEAMYSRRMGSKSGKKGSSNSRKNGSRSHSRSGGGGGMKEEVTLSMQNLSFKQPFGPFFVVVHNEMAEPLYAMGEAASDELADLAESGNPAQLVERYTGMDGVMTAMAGTSAPTFGGETATVTVEVSEEFPYVTVAAMAINTNDCFVALNAVKVFHRGDMSIDVPGLDAGSEVNDESCDSVPGPVCGGSGSSGNGEGFVHVHRGIQGVGDFANPGEYDWRNPMMRVTVA